MLPDFPKTWKEGIQPPPYDFRKWFLGQREEFQLYVIKNLLEDSEVAYQCHLQDHAGAIKFLEELRYNNDTR